MTNVKIVTNRLKEMENEHHPMVYWKPLNWLIGIFALELILKYISYTYRARFMFLTTESIQPFGGEPWLALGWTYSENYGSAFGMFSDQE